MKIRIKRLIQVEQVVDIPVHDLHNDTHLKGRVAIENENLLHRVLHTIKTDPSITVEAKGIADSHLKTELE